MHIYHKTLNLVNANNSLLKVDSGDIKLVYCPSGDMIADMLTKVWVKRIFVSLGTEQMHSQVPCMEAQLLIVMQCYKTLVHTLVSQPFIIKFYIS